MSIIDAFIAEWQQESAGTRKVLERVPEADFDWRPHPKSFSMGLLASHVADIPTYVNAVLDADEFRIEPGGYQPFVAKKNSELVEHFDRSLAAAISAMKAVPDEKMMANWRFLVGDHVAFDMPRIAVFRSMILNHLVHHRAQLTVYLRLRDIAVPGLYGPSADEQ
jgi:uncharacterized damage-inducible protein DinB